MLKLLLEIAVLQPGSSGPVGKSLYGLEVAVAVDQGQDFLHPRGAWRAGGEDWLVITTCGTAGFLTARTLEVLLGKNDPLCRKESGGAPASTHSEDYSENRSRNEPLGFNGQLTEHLYPTDLSAGQLKRYLEQRCTPTFPQAHSAISN